MDNHVRVVGRRWALRRDEAIGQGFFCGKLPCGWPGSWRQKTHGLPVERLPVPPCFRAEHLDPGRDAAAPLEERAHLRPHLAQMHFQVRWQRITFDLRRPVGGVNCFFSVLFAMTSLGKRDGPWNPPYRRPPRYCVPQQCVKSKAGKIMGCPAISTAASDELSLSVCPVLRLLMVGESSSRCGSAVRETGSSTRLLRLVGYPARGFPSRPCCRRISNRCLCGWRGQRGSGSGDRGSPRGDPGCVGGAAEAARRDGDECLRRGLGTRPRLFAGRGDLRPHA